MLSSVCPQEVEQHRLSSFRSNLICSSSNHDAMNTEKAWIKLLDSAERSPGAKLHDSEQTSPGIWHVKKKKEAEEKNQNETTFSRWKQTQSDENPVAPPGSQCRGCHLRSGPRRSTAGFYSVPVKFSE